MNLAIRHRNGAAFGLVVAFAVVTALSVVPLVDGTQAHEGTPSASCLAATPDSGTPAVRAATAVSSPAVTMDCVSTEPAAFGTPVAGGNLVVTLHPDKATAGPRSIVIEIHDTDGAAVNDATVRVRARSIEMDMGESKADAVFTADGHYLADPVNMGMGGDWLVEVDIARPGGDMITVAFRVTLEGLR